MNINATANLTAMRPSRASVFWFVLLFGAMGIAGQGRAAENNSSLPHSIQSPLNAGDTIKAGTYVTEGNWGTLEITNATPDSPMKFSIGAIGANGHVCDLAGKVINGQGIAEDVQEATEGESGVPENKCVIQFKTTSDRVSVIVNPESDDACRYYCGARAWFAGDYFTPIPYCEKSQNVRDEFASIYGAGQYKKARILLTDLLTKCERFMYWHTVAEVRNDLAITELHLGNKTACLKVLEPLKENFIDEDEPYFTPIDQEWGMEMAKMVRFNWKKCGGTAAKYSHADKQ